jgi:phage terminase Nu1 subunit (DNA packaging protein)
MVESTVKETDALPSQSNRQQPEEAPNPLYAAVESLIYQGAVDPIRGAAQWIDHATGSQLDKGIKSGLDYVNFRAPKEAQFGTANWYAQQLGGAVGTMVPFMALRGGIKWAGGKTMAVAPLGRTEAIFSRGTLNAAVSEARLSATTGLVYGTFFRSSDENNVGTLKFFKDRFISGANDAAVFGTMGFANTYVNQSLGKVASGLMTGSETSAASRIGRVVGSPVTSGVIAGIPGGAIDAQFGAWRDNRLLPTESELKERIISNMFVGGAFGKAQRMFAPKETRTTTGNDGTTDVTANNPENRGNRRTPTGDDSGAVRKPYGILSEANVPPLPELSFVDSGVTRPTRAATKTGLHEAIESGRIEDARSFVDAGVLPRDEARQVVLKALESRKTPLTIEDVVALERLNVLDKMSIDDRYQRIATEAATARHAKMHYDEPHLSLEQQRAWLGKPTEGTVDVSVYTGDPKKVPDTLEEFNKNVKTTSEKAVVYNEHGYEIQVPETFAKKLDEVFDLRIKIEDGKKPDASWSERRAGRAAQKELNRHEYRDYVHPAELTSLQRVPHGGLIKKVKFLDRPNADDPWHSKTYKPDFVSAGTAGSDGVITYYQAKQSSKAFLSGLTNHEWAHLLQGFAAKENRAYSSAATLEAKAHSDRAKDGYAVSEYSKRNDSENWAEHSASLLSPDADVFITTADQAPVRAAILGKALQRALSEVPQEQRSPYHDQLQARVDYLKEFVEPRAKHLWKQYLIDGTPQEKKAARNLIDQFASEADLPDLKARSDQSTPDNAANWVARYFYDMALRRNEYDAAARILKHDILRAPDVHGLVGVNELMNDIRGSLGDGNVTEYRQWVERGVLPKPLMENIYQDAYTSSLQYGRFKVSEQLRSQNQLSEAQMHEAEGQAYRNALKNGNIENADYIERLGRLSPDELTLRSQQAMEMAVTKGEYEVVQYIMDQGKVAPEQQRQALRAGIVEGLGSGHLWDFDVLQSKNWFSDAEYRAIAEDGYQRALELNHVPYAQMIYRLNLIPEQTAQRLYDAAVKAGLVPEDRRADVFRPASEDPSRTGSELSLDF